jgi:hypothetical protein
MKLRYFHAVPRLRVGGTLPPCPAYAFMACMGITLPFMVIRCASLEIMCKILLKVSLSVQNWLGVKFSESCAFLFDLIVAEV